MTLYERITQKCKENGLTIKALETKAGFPNATIRKWEKQKPSYDKVVIIADCLNVTLNWLILGKEEGELTEEEQELINLYRQADARGKRSILRTAQDEARELESLTSGTGSTGTGN